MLIYARTCACVFCIDVLNFNLYLRVLYSFEERIRTCILTYMLMLMTIQRFTYRFTTQTHICVHVINSTNVGLFSSNINPFYTCKLKTNL